MNSCLARENHPLVGPDRADPFEGWGPDPVHPGQGAGEWAYPKKRPVAGREGAGWACPSGRAADWWREQKRPAFRRRASRPRASQRGVLRRRVLVLAGVVLEGLRVKEALTMAQLDEAEAASPHWR